MPVPDLDWAADLFRDVTRPVHDIAKVIRTGSTLSGGSDRRPRGGMRLVDACPASDPPAAPASP